jgi:hypothetical protein
MVDYGDAAVFISRGKGLKRHRRDRILDKGIVGEYIIAMPRFVDSGK